MERIWIGYCAAMLAVVALADGGGSATYRPGAFALLHASFLCLQFGIARLAQRWPVRRMRIVRSLMACVGAPLTFSSYAWVLPAVHPEPCEWWWLHCDLALFDGDLSQQALASLSLPVVTWLQLVYASFYLLPVGAAVVAGIRSGGFAFDRATTILLGGFLASYCGYLLLPTLGPNRVFPLHDDAYGDGLAAAIHRAIDAAEANHWDCFPSGHTMMATISALVVSKWARSWLLAFLCIVLPLIASTIYLRYHWPVDVLAGALFAWPTMFAIERMLDRDGMDHS